MLFGRQLKRIGYFLIRSTGEMPQRDASFRHAPVLPAKSTYSPWLTDTAFREVFSVVRENTLVDELVACPIPLPLQVFMIADEA